jgi:hypothetical protein
LELQGFGREHDSARRILEVVADVGIGEAADGVLSGEQGSEDLDFVVCDRVERLGGAIGSDLFRGRDAVQGPDRIGRVFDGGQSQ